MARINYSTFVARKGATLKCSKDGHEIAKGERYMWVKPRSAYRKMVRCMAHPFKQSEITTSKMAGVYAAQEDATANLEGMRGNPEADASSITSELETAAESIREVAEEYREAKEASPTGYVFGEDLEDKASEIEDAASELESWSAEEDEPDYEQCDDEHHDLEVDDPDYHERGDLDNCESCQQVRADWWDAQIDAAIDALNGLSV